MNDDDNEIPPARRRIRPRFSLLALLIFIALASLVLAWLVQPQRVAATALFQVESADSKLFGDAVDQNQDGRSFEILKKTQIALLKSNFLLTSALRNPQIGSLAVFQGQSDPVAWLQEHLEVDFPENAEILSISLRGTEAQAQDLVSIVDAVAKAYKDEVISELRQRRLESRDLLARHLDKLNQEIKDRLELFLDIARQSGHAVGSGQVLQDIAVKRLDLVESELMRLESEQVEAQSKNDAERLKPIELRLTQLRERQSELEKKIVASAEKSGDLETRQRELEQLQRIASEMSMKLEQMDIEASSPERIRQLQPAAISPE